MVQTKLWTVEELVAEFGPEPRYELIRGELREVSASEIDSSIVGGNILRLLGNFVMPNRLGFLTSEDGGYVAGEPESLFAPDVGFISYDRVANRPQARRFFRGIPELAVEVISRTDRLGRINEMLDLYAELRIPIVWIVRIETRTVDVHRPGQEAEQFGMGDTLTGEDVLPGFTLPVDEIFVLP